MTVNPVEKKRKLENEEVKNPTVDELKQSVMKLREQQLALIQSRRGSVSNSSPSPNSAQKSHQLSISTDPHAPRSALPREMLMSPRHEMGHRELPPPTPHHTNGGRISLPPLSASTQPRSRNPLAKQEFLRVFEMLYDQTDHINHLSSILSEQIRQSTTLLQTLQASGSMIEGLVRGHFRDMQSQYSEKFGVALTDLNRRMRMIEEKLDIVDLPSPPTPEGESKLTSKPVEKVAA